MRFRQASLRENASILLCVELPEARGRNRFRPRLAFREGIPPHDSYINMKESDSVLNEQPSKGIPPGIYRENGFVIVNNGS